MKKNKFASKENKRIKNDLKKSKNTDGLPDTARPAPVDRKIYVKFVNKCRTNNKEVNIVLTDLMVVYLKKGEKIFN